MGSCGARPLRIADSVKPQCPARLAAVITLSIMMAGCETTSKPAMPATSAPIGTDNSAARSLAGDVFDISKLDQKPVPRFMARPNYPRAQRDAKIAGEAVVDFVVDTDGNVRNAFALRATHDDFGKAAVEAVEKWKFQPGRRGGRDVNTHMQVPIVFTLSAN